MSICKPAGRTAAYRRQCGRLLALLLLSILVAACSDSPTAPEPVDRPGTITESVAPQVFVDSIPTGTVRYSDPNDAASLQVACGGMEVGAVEADGRVLVMRFMSPLAVDEEALPVTVECAATGTDELGNATERTFSVEVNANPDNPPSASLDGPTSAVEGEDVSFTYSVTDDNAVESITLDYGDGMTTSLTAAEGSTTYAYAAPGTYTLELTATDDAGQRSAPALHTIEVTAPPDPPETYSFMAKCENFWDGVADPSCQLEAVNMTTGDQIQIEADANGVLQAQDLPEGEWRFRFSSDLGPVGVAQLTDHHLEDIYFNVIDGVHEPVQSLGQGFEARNIPLSQANLRFLLNSDIDDVNMYDRSGGWDLKIRTFGTERPYLDDIMPWFRELFGDVVQSPNWIDAQDRKEARIGVGVYAGDPNCNLDIQAGQFCEQPELPPEEDKPPGNEGIYAYEMMNVWLPQFEAAIDSDRLPHKTYSMHRLGNKDGNPGLIADENIIQHLAGPEVYEPHRDRPWSRQFYIPDNGKLIIGMTEGRIGKERATVVDGFAFSGSILVRNGTNDIPIENTYLIPNLGRESDKTCNLYQYDDNGLHIDDGSFCPRFPNNDENNIYGRQQDRDLIDFSSAVAPPPLPLDQAWYVELTE